MKRPLAGKRKKDIRIMNYRLILASNSPRRRTLLAGLGVDFEVRVMQDIPEDYPQGMAASEIPVHISQEKASAYRQQMADDELIITADTVVVAAGQILGKPLDEEDARSMLRLLSGRTHQVITGVSLTTKNEQQSFSVTTEVSFKSLSDEEINYYIRQYHPLDKAGAYGIQEWIGYIGVTGLQGSYYDVMGLPVQRIYEELKKMGYQFL